MPEKTIPAQVLYLLVEGTSFSVERWTETRSIENGESVRKWKVQEYSIPKTVLKRFEGLSAPALMMSSLFNVTMPCELFETPLEGMCEGKSLFSTKNGHFVIQLRSTPRTKERLEDELPKLAKLKRREFKSSAAAPPKIKRQVKNPEQRCKCNHRKDKHVGGKGRCDYFDKCKCEKHRPGKK